MTTFRPTMAVALSIVGIVAAGCGSRSALDDDLAVDDSLVVDTTATIEAGRVASATMRVRADGCGPRTELGTATAIGDGLLVTAAHVVAGADEIALVAAGEATPADVVLFDPGLDVAALRAASDLPGSDVVPAVLRPERGATGETGVLALVGNDDSIELRDVEVLQRVTIETLDVTQSRDVERPGLRIAATVDRGDSGAMVHLPGGGVGIVWSRSTATSGQAWTVDLPPELLRPNERRLLVSPVDNGACT